MPSILRDDPEGPPLGLLFWVLAWPIFWATMAVLRYVSGRRKTREGDEKDSWG